MATIHSLLPGSLKSFVQERANSSDKQPTAEGKLEQALLEGLSSGSSVPVDSIFWRRLHQRASGTTKC